MAEADPQASVLAKITGLEGRQGADGADDLRGAADRDRLGLRHVRGLRLLAHATTAQAGSQGARASDCARQAAPAGREAGSGAAGGRAGCRRRPGRGAGRSRAAGCAAPQCQRQPGVPRAAVPDSDVQRFYRERVVAASEGFEPHVDRALRGVLPLVRGQREGALRHPRVTREIGELGVRKERIGKRTRYFGIALRSETEPRRTRSCRHNCQEQHRPKGKLRKGRLVRPFFYWGGACSGD